MATPEPLAELPKDITTLMAMIPRIGRNLTSVSVDRWFREPSVAEINYLRTIAVDWQISFSKSATSTILFIFRRKKETWVMLEANVSMGVRVANPIEPRPKPGIEDVQRMVRFPTFFWVDPSDSEVSVFGPPGSTKKNTVFFKLGPAGQNILAILNPESGKKAMLRYSPKAIAGQVEPQSGKYSLAPFLDLTWTIRDWLAQNKPASAAVKLDGVPSRDTPVHEILTALLQAYVDSSETLAKSFSNDLFVAYLIDSYKIALNLRLRADGSLAEKKEDEQFRLMVHATTTAGPPPVTSVDLGPPDFLIDGKLFDAFFSALRPPSAMQALAERLGIDPGFLRPFVVDAKANAVIFRIKRAKDHDDDIMVLSGQLLGVETTLIIEASFLVKPEKDPPTVELDEGSIEILKITGGGPPVGQIPFGFVSYYLLLANGLRHWLASLEQW
jgi:hypothetical protein